MGETILEQKGAGPVKPSAKIVIISGMARMRCAKTCARAS